MGRHKGTKYRWPKWHGQKPVSGITLQLERERMKREVYFITGTMLPEVGSQLVSLSGRKISVQDGLRIRSQKNKWTFLICVFLLRDGREDMEFIIRTIDEFTSTADADEKLLDYREEFVTSYDLDELVSHGLVAIPSNGLILDELIKEVRNIFAEYKPWDEEAVEAATIARRLAGELSSTMKST